MAILMPSLNRGRQSSRACARLSKWTMLSLGLIVDSSENARYLGVCEWPGRFRDRVVHDRTQTTISDQPAYESRPSGGPFFCLRWAEHPCAAPRRALLFRKIGDHELPPLQGRSLMPVILDLHNRGRGDRRSRRKLIADGMGSGGPYSLHLLMYLWAATIYWAKELLKRIKEDLIDPADDAKKVIAEFAKKVEQFLKDYRAVRRVRKEKGSEAALREAKRRRMTEQVEDLEKLGGRLLSRLGMGDDNQQQRNCEGSTHARRERKGGDSSRHS